MAGINEITKEMILDYYANLLILQYRNKRKARAQIKEEVKAATGDFLLYRLYEFFDVDSAVGAQLDIIGRIVGAKRQVVGLTIDKDYFNYVNRVENHGFSRLGSVKPYMFKNKQNSKNVLYSLVDQDYRILIKFKIIANHIKATMKDIDDACWQYFGKTVVVVNNMDMTMSYYITARNIPGVLAAYRLGYLPQPNGVGIELILNVPTPDLIFGFRRANSAYNGVGFSRAGKIQPGTWLTKDNVVRIV